MGSSQNFSIAVEMFGADIDDALSTQSDRKSFLPLGRLPPASLQEPAALAKGSIMEDELKSLQSKIIDLETKLSFSYLPEDQVTTDTKPNDKPSNLKSRTESTDADRTQ